MNNENLTCELLTHNNVVKNNKLHDIQTKTLNYLKDCLACTYGPMGSYSIILKGSDWQSISSEYSKDGMKVLKHIIFDSPIEMSIQSQIVDITTYVESKVGDGTTSAVILSSLVYNALYDIIKIKKIPPRMVVEALNSIVNVAKKLIMANKKDVSLDDIYRISMISTNGNTKISNMIKGIYKNYGLDANISVGISNDEKTKIKEYDGLTLNEGYSDPAYINNQDTGSADIRNPKIYAFQNPIDTPEMVMYLEKIIFDNILEPGSTQSAYTPTVILTPRISRDASSIMNDLVTFLYNCDKAGSGLDKPPILIITNFSGTDEEIFLDIARLCGCKYIRKYIDPEIQKKDQENGKAPTPDTIHEFAGSAELVSADLTKTKFVNPYDLIHGNKSQYDSLIKFLKSEIENAKNINEDPLTIARLNKRLKALEANMIDLLVGGISTSDRDSLRDLVEDAVKNCASAVEYGYGRAANFEGMFAFKKIYNNMKDDSLENISEFTKLKFDITKAFLDAYIHAANILYGTVYDDATADKLVQQSLENECPFDIVYLFEQLENNINIKDLDKGTDIICSIKTDVEVLDAISKIISIMVTSNQCLLQSTTINRY